MSDIAYWVLASIEAVCAAVSLYSAVSSLRKKQDFMFAVETIFTVLLTAFAIMCGVKVWW